MNTQDKVARTQMSAPQPTAHTAEPWHVNPRGFIVDSTGAIVTRMECSEDAGNATRIVACVSAMAGINPEAVPELIAVLENIAETAEEDDGESPTETLLFLAVVARAALAKAKGGAK